MYVLLQINLAHKNTMFFASGCQLKGQQKLSTPSTIYRWEWTNKVFFGWRTRRSSCFYILGGDIWPCKIQGQVAQQLYLLCHTVSLLFTYITLYNTYIALGSPSNITNECTAIILGTIHFRRHHFFGGEGSTICQICRRLK